MYADPTKIICIGRNYAEHARELNNALPAEPFYFLKPPSSVIRNGQSIVLPGRAGRVDYEGELGVVMIDRCRNLAEKEVFAHIMGFVVCNDVTAREMQDTAKKVARPWAVSKGFDTFFPMSELRMKRDVPDPASLDIETKLNGTVKQKGNTRDMIFPIQRIVSDISGIMTLERGDVIATGTPAGISQLHAGDVIEITIEKVGKLTNSVVSD